MAMLCGGIDSDRIHLIGRWQSDEMYRYLHVQAQPVMAGISATMLRGDNFCLNPPPFSTAAASWPLCDGPTSTASHLATQGPNQVQPPVHE